MNDEPEEAGRGAGPPPPALRAAFERRKDGPTLSEAVRENTRRLSAEMAAAGIETVSVDFDSEDDDDDDDRLQDLVGWVGAPRQPPPGTPPPFDTLRFSAGTRQFVETSHASFAASCCDVAMLLLSREFPGWHREQGAYGSVAFRPGGAALIDINVRTSVNLVRPVEGP